MARLLAAERLTAGYGDSIVLEDVSFEIDEGGSLALLGRNGVGKTTLLLTLMGLTRLKSGTPGVARAQTSRACRRSAGRRPDWDGSRRSASCFRRSRSRNI